MDSLLFLSTLGPPLLPLSMLLLFPLARLPQGLPYCCY